MNRILGFRLAVLWLSLLGLGVLAAYVGMADPLQVDLTRLLAHPDVAHLAGTDELGRDVLSRTLHAASATLLVTVGATLLDMLLALLFGLFAAYHSGLADRVLAVTIDLFWTVPFVVFVVLFVTLVGVSIASLIVSIAMINWVTAARIIRAEGGRLRQETFVRAAEAFGFSPLQVVMQQIVPSLAPTLLALTAYTAIEVLTLETGLAFIGLSLPAPTPTWGGMLADGLGYLNSASWLVLMPAAAISLTLISLQFLAKRFEQHEAEHTS